MKEKAKQSEKNRRAAAKQVVIEELTYETTKYYVVRHPHGASAFDDKVKAKAFRDKRVEEIARELDSMRG